MYFIYQIEGKFEPELSHLKSLVDGGGVAVDVGANLGLYTYRLSQLATHVYAFEINQDVTKDLKSYEAKNVTLINRGLSSREGMARLYIPVFRGFALNGWGSLTEGNYRDATDHLTVDAPVEILDRYNLTDVNFIKIDVEGHEVEVLMGAARTIERNRPKLLVEIKEQNMPAVRTFFQCRGYRMLKLEDLIGVAGADENYIFIPEKGSQSP